ncbi:MAG TPA: DNA repair exonuclease [Leptolyngbyaceae cyanobacterium M33_DOE_097]|uniref:Nuclease SbcCD subunit D n=1 Tax=Oscillatoriales cyanobacterium SpSt-418 TaxID=2282169 RepID=A0A7C3PBA9_9CYAN|nr:DNA repair exonuclease [Leptolyngbyaceae cyanobacterium M33_DOE_097]
MPRFLHIADIHLGYDKYDNPERTKDFYFALQDVIDRYAIAANVDFVLIAGDLFEHRNLQPHILNQAQLCLDQLKQANIPVLAIEGNHDNRPYGTKTSWLRYLADWGLLMLLEPELNAEGVMVYTHWNPESKRGGYIDLPCGIRVLGSQWYGTSAPRAIATIAAAIQTLPPAAGSTVMMFHHGLEGQIARYEGALRYADLLPLQEVGVSYLALGHIHKNYAREGWVFNPGSLEANNVEEAGYQRGAYLVEVTPAGFEAELKQDYYQRSCVRLRLTAKGQETQAEIEAAAIATVQTAIAKGHIVTEEQPIVELKIDGKIGFDRLELNTRQLQHELQQLSNALIFLLKFDAESIEFETHITEEANRLQIEQEIFTDMLAAHNTYKAKAQELALGLIELKDQQMQGHSEEEMYEFAKNLLI